jgi:tripartite-type tricarboxylate transporter receptor subunit TctC
MSARDPETCMPTSRGERISTQALRHAGAMALAAILTAATGTRAGAQTAEQFYRSTKVTIMLGVPPGGSYDLYARLAANHLKKHIPGGPNVIVEHRPGGGGIRAVAYFYGQSPRDGSVLGLFAETITHTQLLQPNVGKWNLAEMSYVGSFTGVNAAFVIRKGAPAKTVDDLRKVPINIGCTGRNSQSYQSPAILKKLGEYPYKIICGYPGSAELVFAMAKGEIDMVSSAWNNWRATHRDEIAAGSLIPMIQVGLTRHKELANVPLMQELVDDASDKATIEFASASSAIGRALIAPPQVPADRLAALRQAFDRLVKDPDFLRDTERVRAEIDPKSGAEAQAVSEAILRAPQEIIAKAAKAME